MRNSFMPLILVLGVTVMAIPMIMKAPPRGSGGPEINPGVFCPSQKAIYQVASLPIAAENRATWISIAPKPEGGAGPGLDLRRFIVVSGEDHSPLTAAVMYALAETITKRGGAAILDPLRGPASDTGQVLALGASYVIRVATIDGATPQATSGACAAVIRCRTSAVRLPAAHPAARLQQNGGEHASVLSIAHHSTGGQGSWPSWYAGFGRGIAETVIDQLGAGAPAGSADLELADWGSQLPQPPQADTLRWTAAFQHQLVRGWIGRVAGKTTIARDGSTEPALAQLERHLGKGGWKRVEQPGAGLLQEWERAQESASHDTDAKATKEGDAKDELSSRLSVREDDAGYDIIAWQERPHPAELFQQWLDAATDGTEPAGERARRELVPERTRPPAPKPEAVRERALRALARHLDCEAIPEEFRARARILVAGAPVAPAAPASAATPAATPAAVPAP